MTTRVLKGRGLLDAENVTEASLQSEANKKNAYKVELQRQMEEKKERERLEKEKRKKEETVEEERVKREIEEKKKKFEREKEIKEKDRKEKEEKVRRDAEEREREKEREKAEKRKNVRSGSRGNSSGADATEGNNKGQQKEEIEFFERYERQEKQEKPFEIGNIQEMIRTNHDWINTKLSKEYVLYKRREEGGEQKVSESPTGPKVDGRLPQGHPDIGNFNEDLLDKQGRMGGLGRKEVDYNKQELMGQLERAKVEIKLSIREKLWKLLTGGTKPIANYCP